MLGSVWVSLLQRIPEKQHENLVLVTTAGAEIMVQRIICHEETYMILRGRPTGSTDIARNILLPFDQLNYLAFHKPMLEEDILAMFAPKGAVESATPVGATAAEAPPDEKAAPAAAPAEAVAPPPVDAPMPPQPEVPAESDRLGPPSKSMLLARLRARLGKNPPS